MGKNIFRRQQGQTMIKECGQLISFARGQSQVIQGLNSPTFTSVMIPNSFVYLRIESEIDFLGFSSPT
jgi:hypothetical protein